MKIKVLSLFPEMFAPVREMSILGRACQKGLLEIRTIDIRDYTLDKHKKTDDTPFGGGAGMVMAPEPVFRALEAAEAGKGRIFYMSPRGRMLDEALLREIAALDEWTLVCGHYEGLDQRAIERWGMEEISIGDYILTGGELPAMVLIDAAARFLPGVLGSEESNLEESVYSGLLEYPQYTKPRSFREDEVPEVLLSGDHRKIRLWRLEQSLRLTAERRPDLFERYLREHGTPPDKEERRLIGEIAREHGYPVEEEPPKRRRRKAD